MELTIDKSKLTLDNLDAFGKAFPVARQKALNRTATQAKAKAITLVTQKYNIKRAGLAEKIKVNRVTKKDTGDQASLTISSRRPNLSEFGATYSGKTSPGVSVEVVKGRRIIVAGSFITKVGGHTGVFIRGVLNENNTKRTKGIPRREKRKNLWGSTELPIDELKGPSISQMFFGRKVYKPLDIYVRERIVANLHDAINYFKK